MNEQTPEPRPGEAFNPYSLPEYRRAMRSCRWITPSEYRAWEALVDRAGKDGYCITGARRLAEDIGCSVDHARELIRSLANKKAITLVPRHNDNGRQMSNQTRFTFIPIEQLTSICDSAEVCESPEVGEVAQVGNDPEGEVGKVPDPGVGEVAHPLTYPQERIPKERKEAFEKNSGVSEEPNDTPPTDRIAWLKWFLNAPKLIGRPIDDVIVQKIATELGDTPRELFERILIAWRRKNEPRTYAIYVSLAADAREQWQASRQEPRAKRENLTSSESATPRRMADTPNAMSHAPSGSNRETRDVKNVSGRGLRPVAPEALVSAFPWMRDESYQKTSLPGSA